MAASPTTRVEIDTDLLDRLRKRCLERSDRELFALTNRWAYGAIYGSSAERAATL